MLFSKLILDFSTIQISTCVFLEKDLFCIFRRFKFRVMLFFEKDYIWIFERLLINGPMVGFGFFCGKGFNLDF